MISRFKPIDGDTIKNIIKCSKKKGKWIKDNKEISILEY